MVTGAVKKRVRYRRVVLLVSSPSGSEDEIARGAIDYALGEGRWRFLKGGYRPYLPFERIDLGAVDGLIGGIVDPQWADAVQRAGIAAVNTSTRQAGLPLPRVGNDDEEIGRVGARHLLELGFSHFGFMGIDTHWYAERRLAGFRRVLEEDAGRTCATLALPPGRARAASARVRAWLARLPKPVAVMTASDHQGLMALNAATALGLRVPDDVAVLGVDNDHWAAALAPVPMSSVAVDARRIGARAAALLDRLMRGRPPPPPEWIPPLGVAARRSTDIVVQEDPVVARALAYIRAHCAEAIGVEDVSSAIHVSRRTLEMRLRRTLGLTPMAALSRARIERAKKMLMESDRTTARIAELCGFEWQEHFHRVFKRQTGLTPGQFRRRRPSERGTTRMRNAERGTFQTRNAECGTFRTRNAERGTRNIPNAERGMRNAEHSKRGTRNAERGMTGEDGGRN